MDYSPEIFRLRFNLPASTRTFGRFLCLPVEIRHQIWELSIREPGMHFLRLTAGGHVTTPIPFDLPAMALIDDGEDQDYRAGGHSPEVHHADDMAVARQIKYERVLPRRPTQKAILEQFFPNIKADISHHTALNDSLSRLAATCMDSYLAVRHLIGRPGGIRMVSGSQRIVTLSDSDDTLCLEYIPTAMFEGRCHMPSELDCPDLSRIRRLAVPYCVKWELPYRRTLNAQSTLVHLPAASASPPSSPSSSAAHQQHQLRRCTLCGLQHPDDGRRVPTHLYQFISLYLPNLEQFYFIDYMVHRKSSLAPKLESPYYHAAGRIYYEAAPETWHIRSDVMCTLDRLRRSFRYYSKNSDLNRHRNPDRVRFGLLACEWTQASPHPLPVHRRRLSAPTSNPYPCDRVRQGRDPASGGGEFIASSSLPIVFGQASPFEFTFELKS